jgi:hypothetical protein
MSKTRRRRLAQRARAKERALAWERELAAPKVDRPVNWSRLHQIYSNMTLRGGIRVFPKGLVFGPLVDATTPEELEEQTNRVYILATLGQREN